MFTFGLAVDMLSDRLSSIKAKIIIHIEMVFGGHRLCSSLDLFRIRGLENTLGGPLSTRSCALYMFLYWCRFYISTFAVEVHGRDEYSNTKCLHFFSQNYWVEWQIHGVSIATGT